MPVIEWPEQRIEWTEHELDANKIELIARVGDKTLAIRDAGYWRSEHERLSSLKTPVHPGTVQLLYWRDGWATVQSVAFVRDSMPLGTTLSKETLRNDKNLWSHACAKTLGDAIEKLKAYAESVFGAPKIRTKAFDGIAGTIVEMQDALSVASRASCEISSAVRIAIFGPPRCGKSTLAAFIATQLRENHLPCRIDYDDEANGLASPERSTFLARNMAAITSRARRDIIIETR